MKKLKSAAKTGLLIAALFVTSIGFLPKAAEAWVLTIYCDGGSEYCASVDFFDENDDHLGGFDFFLGNYLGYTFVN